MRERAFRRLWRNKSASKVRGAWATAQARAASRGSVDGFIWAQGVPAHGSPTADPT